MCSFSHEKDEKHPPKQVLRLGCYAIQIITISHLRIEATSKVRGITRRQSKTLKTTSRTNRRKPQQISKPGKESIRVASRVDPPAKVGALTHQFFRVVTGGRLPIMPRHTVLIQTEGM